MFLPPLSYTWRFHTTHGWASCPMAEPPLPYWTAPEQQSTEPAKRFRKRKALPSKLTPPEAEAWALEGKKPRGVRQDLQRPPLLLLHLPRQMFPVCPHLCGATACSSPPASQRARLHSQHALRATTPGRPQSQHALRTNTLERSQSQHTHRSGRAAHTACSWPAL